MVNMTDVPARCTRQLAQIAAKRAKFLSSLLVTVPFIVRTVFQSEKAPAPLMKGPIIGIGKQGATKEIIPAGRIVARKRSFLGKNGRPANGEKRALKKGAEWNGLMPA